MLSESNPKWELRVSLQDLKSSNQIIGLASSYNIRTLDVITGNNYSEEYITELKAKIKALSKEKTNAKSRQEMKSLNEELFKQLYIPQLCFIHMDKASHYDRLNKGFSICVYNEETGEIFCPLTSHSFINKTKTITTI